MTRLFFWLLMMSCFGSRASEVKINGVSALPGYPVRVLVHDDLLSSWKVELASASSDFKGSFALHFSLKHPAWVTLAAAQYKTELFVVPGGKYSLKLELKKGENFSFYDPQPLTIKTISAEDNGLSEAVEAVNVVYNAFVVEHFNALYRMQQSKLIDTLRAVMDKLAPKFKSQFFADFVFYKVATLEPVVRNLVPTQVYERFFRGRPILTHQPEYVSLLRETFKNHLLNSRFWTQQEYLEAVTKGWNSFEALLMRDNIMAEDKAFREVVALLHFAANYNHPLHRQDALQGLLAGLAASTKIPEHKRIADNITRMAVWLLPGTSVPEFSLRDETGKVIAFDGQSRAMLLIFVGPECSYCDFELQQLREIHARIAHQFSFITVSLPESQQHYRNIHRRNKLDWPVYSLGHNYQLLDMLDVRVFPHLAVTLPGLRAGMIPAPPTDQRLEAHLTRIARQFEKP